MEIHWEDQTEKMVILVHQQTWLKMNLLLVVLVKLKRIQTT